MQTRNLLYKNSIRINDDISVVIPTVGQILGDEDGYYGLVSALTAMPIDFMVPLDDAGIDFTTIDEYELFLRIFPGIKELDTSLVFGDLDLKRFTYGVNEQNGNIIVVDPEKQIVIDRAIHSLISDALREIHHIEKNTKKPANEETRKYLIERARKKIKRRRNLQEKSQLESQIISMVNTEQYKYDFERTLGLSIYQFNVSVRQIVNKINYDNRMYGVYTGTINVKDLSQDELNWLSQK